MAFPVDDKFIADAESKLGIRLPNSYKGRVRRDNGGEIEALDDVWQLHPVLDTSDRKRIAKTSSHIVRETELAREWTRFPQNAIAFADGGTGDKLIFMPQSDDPTVLGETVFFWDHETGEITLVADDLADLS